MKHVLGLLALIVLYYQSGARGESIFKKGKHDPGIDFNRHLTGVYFDPANFIKYNGLSMRLDDTGMSALVTKVHSQFDHIMVPIDGNSSNFLVPEAVANHNKILLDGNSSMQVSILYGWEAEDEINLLLLQWLRKIADDANDIFLGTVKTILLEMKPSVGKSLQQYYDFRRQFTQSCRDGTLQGHQYQVGIQLSMKQCEAASSKVPIWEDVVRYGYPDMVYLFQSVNTQNTVDSVDGYVKMFTDDFRICKRAIHTVSSGTEVGFMSTWPDTGSEGRLKYSNLVEFWGRMNKWAGETGTSTFLLQAFDSPLGPQISKKTNGWWRLIPNSSYQVPSDFMFAAKHFLKDPNIKSDSANLNLTLKWLGQNFQINNDKVGISFHPIPLKTSLANFSQDWQTAQIQKLGTTFSKLLVSIETSSVGDSNQIPMTVARFNRYGRNLANRTIQVTMTFDKVTAIYSMGLANEANNLYANTVKLLLYRPNLQINHFTSDFYPGGNSNEMDVYQLGVELPLELCYEGEPFDALLEKLRHAPFDMIYFSGNVTPSNSKLGVGRMLPQLTATFERCKARVEQYFKALNNETMEVGFLTGWPLLGGGEDLEGLIQFVEFWERMSQWAAQANTSIFLSDAFDAPDVGLPNKYSPKYGWWRLDEQLSEASRGFVFKSKKEDAEGLATETVKKDTSPAGFQSVDLLQMSIMISLVAALIAVCLAAIIYYYRKRKSKYLTGAEIGEFFNGGQSTAEDELVQNFNTAYNKALELPEAAFKIDESSCLGSGEFGKVCRAVIIQKGGDPGGGPEEVAVKMTKLPCTRAALRGLIFEVKILSFLGAHPYIVELKGAYTAKLKKSKMFVFLEHCTQGSLKGYLKKFKPVEKVSKEDEDMEASNDSQPESAMERNELDETLASDMLKWAGEIAKGMEFIASKHIVHMDLAVRNVLLTADKIAKITDFGLSRRMCNYLSYKKNQNPEDQEPLPWRSMAPESLRKMEFTQKSDVWGFGVTLWEIFSLGEEPYCGQNWNPNFPSQLEKGLRLGEPSYNQQDMYSVMLRCWNATPQKRPTFSELAKILYHAEDPVMPEGATVQITDPVLPNELLHSTNLPTPPPNQIYPPHTGNETSRASHGESENTAIPPLPKMICSLELNPWFKRFVWSLLTMLIICLVIAVSFIIFQRANDRSGPEEFTNVTASIRNDSKLETRKSLPNNSYRFEVSNTTTPSSSFKTETKGMEDKQADASLLQLEAFKYLADISNEPFAKDEENNTFLHRLLLNGERWTTPSGLHRLTKYLVESNLTRLFQIPGGGNTSATPLHWAVHHHDMEAATVSLLAKNCVDLNLLDGAGKSILIYAIEGRKDSGFLSKLIFSGADWRCSSFEKRSPLHFAAQGGNVEGLKFLLKLGLPINGVDSRKNTPLHLAAQIVLEEGLGVVQFLVENGAHVNAKNEKLATPLYSAATSRAADLSNPLKIIKYLIAHNADVFSAAEFGRTFLHELVSMDGSSLTPSQFHELSQFLVSEGYSHLFTVPENKEAVTPFQLAAYHLEMDWETLTLLNRSQVDFNVADTSKRTGLFYAVRGKRSVAMLKSLIEFGADWRHLDKEGCSLLHSAARFDNLEALKFFFAKGLNADQAEFSLGSTPLHFAARFGNETLLKMVQFFLQSLAYKNVPDRLGRSTLHQLAQNNVSEVEQILESIKYLVSTASENVYRKDTNLNTFLHLLLLTRNVTLSPSQLDDLVQFLVRMGHSRLFDIHGGEDSVDATTPLQLAVRYIHVKNATLSLLRAHAVNFNAVDKNGNSVLGHAIMGNTSSSLVSSLIWFGAEPKYISNAGNMTLLHDAGLFGNVETMKLLLNQGLAINAPDVYKCTPLHRVAEFGKTNLMEMVRFLVEHGADVNAPSYHQRTPIHMVTYNDDIGMGLCLKIIRYLIENKADPFVKTNANLTFLHELFKFGTAMTPSQLQNLGRFLVEQGNSKVFDGPESAIKSTPFQRAVMNIEIDDETLSILSRAGVNFNALNKFGHSVLHYALMGNRSPRLIASLIKFGADPKYLDDNDANYIHWTAKFGHLGALKVFRDQRLDINGVDVIKDTPLSRAVANGNKNVVEIVEFLVENGADVNASNRYKMSPIHVVTFNKKIDMDTILQIIKYLMENKADVFSKSNNGRTFLHELLMPPDSKLTPVQFHDLVSDLVEAGHSKLLEVQEDGFETSPLHWAVFNFELEVKTVTLLNQVGTDFNMVDKEGDSILFYAVSGNRGLNQLGLLTKFGADPRLLDRTNRTLLHVAAQIGNSVVAHFFLDRGVDINSIDNFKDTPLHKVLRYGKKNVVETTKFLVEHGADVNATGHRLESPIYKVTLNQFIDMDTCLQLIVYLIEKQSNVFLKSNDGHTFLHALLRKGTNLTASQLHQLSTFLVGKGHSKIFNIAENSHGATPFHWAVSEIELEEVTLALLNESGASFNVRDKAGSSVFTYALAGGRSRDFLALLAKYGADCRYVSHRNQSLLHFAVFYGNVEALELFMKMGADVNISDVDGNTALHYAVILGKENVLKLVGLLVDGGAQADIANVDGFTPLSIVPMRKDMVDKDKVVVELLRARRQK